MTAKAKAAPVTTRRRPDVSGVAGALVPMPAGLRFGATGRVSPYVALLEQLESAGPRGQVLCFESPRAKASVWAQAKKLGMMLQYAEHEGKLYVKFVGYAPGSDRFKRLVRDRILDVIKTNPRNPIQITTELRGQGFADVDASMVDTILKQMEQQGLVGRKSDGSWLNRAS